MPGQRRLQFYQADVFTDEPFGGNPVAVFPDADGLTDEELQRIWLLLKILSPLSVTEATELLVEKFRKTKTNADFLAMMQKM